ncbi:MAG TPA: aminomethyl transferase family protein [Myxococcales bacterium]|nr:aminomethyl transferase family protein [Myxococcales bacterium]HIK85034.1 aminomethyl transferase family protein [Myxococcales bacterium]
MTIQEMIEATRQGVGLFEMADRGLLEVRGEDRVRWLDGMISQDVAALEASDAPSGCYALLLTNKGAIVADLHVGRIGDVYYLESLRSEIPRIRETLDRYIIADDVVLTDLSDERPAIGLEGPGAAGLLSKISSPETKDLERECWMKTSIAECEVLVGAFGFSGEAAFQIRANAADRGAVEEAIAQAGNLGEANGLFRGSPEALGIMRVEAGIALLGAELDEDVLPPEARLEAAISTTKGCYVGQEIVARLRARGQVNHLLVGFRVEAGELPDADVPLSADGRVTGELTSVVSSPTAGKIALGFVRREHAEVGTEVEFSGGRATVSALPFVEIGVELRPSVGRAVPTAASTT